MNQLAVVKKKLLKGELRTALDILVRIKSVKQNEIEALYSRFNINEKKYERGTVSEENYSIEVNKINNTALDYVNELQNETFFFSVPKVIFIPLILLFLIALFKILDNKPDTNLGRKDKINTTNLDDNTLLLPSKKYTIEDVKPPTYSLRVDVEVWHAIDSLYHLKYFDEALKRLYRLESNGKQLTPGDKVSTQNFIGAIYAHKNHEIDEVIFGFPSKFLLGIKEEKYGLFDLEGKVVIETKFDNIDPLYEPIYITEINSKYGMLDMNGKEVLAPIYDLVHPYWSPLVLLEINDKFGLANQNGDILQEIIYDSIEMPNEGLMTAKLDNKWGVIDSLGKIIIDFEYDHLENFEDGKTYAVRNGTRMYINKNGVIIEKL